jgi:hypothetical protein
LVHAALRGGHQEVVALEQAADVLWVLNSFPTYDSLATGRGLSTEETADLLVTMAERTLCR